MATITDVSKLRPELLDMSIAELERRRTEIDMALADKRHAEEVKAKEALAAEAGTRVERLIEDVKWLHDNALLPQRISEAFTRGDGQFNPATFIRKPKAEDLVPSARRKPEGPVRRRRRKDPVTGEYVPSKAARKAGEA